MQIIFLIKRVVSDQKLIMKCIVCGTRMHYRNFFKVLKDENFLGWKNKKKTVTTENITRTNWPRKVRELILDSVPWSQGVKGWA